MPPSVLLVRASGTPDQDASALAARGYAVDIDPYLEIRTCSDSHAKQRALDVLEALGPDPAWLVLASATGIRSLCDLLGEDVVAARLQAAPALRCAAVGPTSAAALQTLGASEIVVPLVHTASGLLDRLAQETPGRAVLPRSSIADAVIPRTLRARGWQVVERALYETTAVAEQPRTAERLRRGEFGALVLRSPSAARAVSQFAGTVPSSTRIVAGGPTTALAAARLGLAVSVVAEDSTAAGIARAVHRAQSARKGAGDE